MNKYNVVIEMNDSTVVTEYEPVKRKSDSYQSEQTLENEFIRMLTEQGYDYLEIHDSESLIKNLRTQLEIVNDYKFTDSEWDRFFNDSIANNIAIAKKDATHEEIMEACRKASIHDFIMALPKGYDTEVGELGDTLSGGEKQRIGIARAFLHDAPMILMDEPTSNLDSLNEGIILKSLKESSKQKTIVLVSHRASTMNIADTVYEMKNGRIS